VFAGRRAADHPVTKAIAVIVDDPSDADLCA
jgi:hypothetical protein